MMYEQAISDSESGPVVARALPVDNHWCVHTDHVRQHKSVYGDRVAHTESWVRIAVLTHRASGLCLARYEGAELEELASALRPVPEGLGLDGFSTGSTIDPDVIAQLSAWARSAGTKLGLESYPNGLRFWPRIDGRS